uniref:Uncharacterized protein n=1 Tax=viral metagenome TaxID=1070528 RepID=A0A6C0J8M4_9ZZZZ
MLRKKKRILVFLINRLNNSVNLSITVKKSFLFLFFLYR